MPYNKSKSKGKSFERDIAKFLCSIFDLNFERVPNSGAFVGGKNVFRTSKISEEQKLLMDGDIIVPKELSKFSIECKNYKSFLWHKLFKANENKQLNEWLKQTIQTTKPYWFLCFKITHQSEYVVFDTRLKDYFYIGNYLIYTYNNMDVLITDLKLFFEQNKEKILELNDSP